MRYYLHHFHGWDASVANMISEYCESMGVRVHTFYLRDRPTRRNPTPTYTVLFETIEKE